MARVHDMQRLLQRGLILTCSLVATIGSANLSSAQSPTWTNWTPGGTVPPALQGAAAIFDPVRRRMIVFGGGGNGDIKYNDVYALNLDGVPAWTHLTPTGGPPTAREDATAIYDPNGDRMIVFGGETESNTEGSECLQTILFNDVWALSLSGTPTWTQLNGGSGPCERSGHSAVYDPIGHRMLVFGGAGYLFTESCVTLLERNDTWAFALTGTPAWSQVNIHYLSGNCAADNDQEFQCPDQNGEPRRNLSSCNFPTFKQYQGSIFDPVRNRMMILGGFYYSDFNYSDLFQLALASDPHWNHLPTGGPGNPSHPAGHGFVSMTYASDTDRIYSFGGTDLTLFGANSFNDTWYLPLNGNETAASWVQLSFTGALPAPRYLHDVIYDPVTQRVIVFGGVDDEGQPEEVRFNDVWALNLNPAPPSTITLSLDAVHCHSMDLSWAAPGDDGTTGTASAYDMRYRLNTAITASNFSSSLQMSAPAPLVSGTVQTATLSNIPRNTKYYFAIRAQNHAGSWSLVSNSPWGKTPNVEYCDDGFASRPVVEQVEQFEFSGPWPNPAVQTVNTSLAIPKSMEGQSLEIAVYDVMGRQVRVIERGRAVTGVFRREWDLRNTSGARVERGMYFLRLSIGDQRYSRSVLVRQ